MNTTKNKKFKWGLVAVMAMLAVVFSGNLFTHHHAAGGGGVALATGAAVDPAELKTLLQQIKEANEQLKKDYNEQKKTLEQYDTNYKALKKDFDEANEHLNKLRKAGLAAAQVKLAHEAVSADCAKYIAAIALCQFDQMGGLGKSNMDQKQRETLMGECRSILGIEGKSALTSSDIPLPTQYGSQVVELIWKFGQARQYATVYPLGAGTVKLPKLATSPTFGFVNQSASITEKSPQISFVTFAPAKAGGLVRVPTEIDMDSIVPLGQFLARYIAREAARWEDTCLFTGDGTSTYNNIKGVGKFAIDNSGVVTLASTKTHITDIAIGDLRAVRAKVNPAALNTAAYYCHPTMEAFLASFNSSTFIPFVRKPDGTATFEGFPVRWVGVMLPYDTSAHVSTTPIYFGDLSYWYFGERSSISVETSREVFFATDELAVRALERFDIENMATDATAAIQLAAS